MGGLAVISLFRAALRRHRAHRHSRTALFAATGHTAPLAPSSRTAPQPPRDRTAPLLPQALAQRRNRRGFTLRLAPSSRSCSGRYQRPCEAHSSPAPRQQEISAPARLTRHQLHGSPEGGRTTSEAATADRRHNGRADAQSGLEAPHCLKQAPRICALCFRSII